MAHKTIGFIILQVLLSTFVAAKSGAIQDIIIPDDDQGRPMPDMPGAVGNSVAEEDGEKGGSFEDAGELGEDVDPQEPSSSEPPTAGDQPKKRILLISSHLPGQLPTIPVEHVLPDVEGHVTKRATDVLSSEEKEKIIEMHNAYRKNVTPPAEAMMEMYWDEHLARSAQKIADECRENKHDDLFERRIKTGLGVPVGQNYALGPNTTGWPNAVAAWYNENKFFHFGFTSTKVVGHYTQEVRDVSSLIGCGSHYCPAFGGRSFYCNYAYVNMDYTNPYKNGTQCALCPNTCTDGLCDCGHKLCRHGGLLDVDKCTCSCKYGFSGDQCENCPVRDLSSHCGGFYTAEMCGQYINVPDECPVMCGECEEKCTVNLNCKNGGDLVEKEGGCGCECIDGWSGPTCECNSTMLLKTDHWYCPQYGNGYCGKYGGQITSMCPQMCKIC